jgi:rhodanese-related sulfurtransferase
MDGTSSKISSQDLYARLGTAAAPVVIDVRREPTFQEDDKLIAGAIRRRPDAVETWRGALDAARPVVVYCARGHEVSQGAAAALRAAGVDAAFLEGGIAAWQALGLPTRRRVGASPGKWVTRERPKIDRIACPWLVRRFIDPEAEFLYVPVAEVAATVERTGAVAYDVKGAEFGHHGEKCSFDAFIGIYGIADKPLDRLATIVRGADTGRPELTPESPGLLAVSAGLGITHEDDHAMLAQGMVIYDALYAWCRRQEAA